MRPSPGASGRRSSSSTAVSSLMTNLGPLAPTSTAPCAPASLEPNRSMIMAPGSWAARSAFTVADSMAPPDPITMSFDTS